MQTEHADIQAVSLQTDAGRIKDVRRFFCIGKKKRECNQQRRSVGANLSPTTMGTGISAAHRQPVPDDGQNRESTPLKNPTL